MREYWPPHSLLLFTCCKMSSEYPNLVWRQTAPGLWQRNVDEIEQFYASMVVLYEGSGRMFFGITGHVSLNVHVPLNKSLEEAESLVDQALRKAWSAMRRDHPTIAAQVTQNVETQEWTKTYRQSRDEADTQSWLEKTLVSVATGQTGEEWANSDPPAPKLPTLFNIHVAPKEPGSRVIRRDLVLRSPHDIVDGVGTLILLSNLIAQASKAYDEGDGYQIPVLDGSEAANLSPSYRIAANVPPQLSEAQQRRIEDIAAEKAEAAASTDVEIIGLPFRKGATLPGRHQRAALTLSKHQTSQVLAFCKSISATPTHVFHAAAALVMRDLQDRATEDKRVRYINYILRNERSSCAEPYNTTKHPAALYHSVSGQSLVVDMTLAAAGETPDDQNRREEFLAITQVMKEFYHSVRNDQEHYALAPVMWAAGTPPLPPSPRPLPVPPPKSQASVSISSMGRTDAIVPPRVGAFDVQNPWVTGEELGNGLGLFLGTFNGEMCLSAAYNDAWHTKSDIADYLDRCAEVVFNGLRSS
ncbi:hypothetical protein EDB81DRAFT_773793 [Dactylonectria macrodidyma]|uniref:Uncharacterized protein n=1 Tax=Dactylonectria macrodidyma TaxID=307937 RepID=A0A9P9FWQ4_9HYPO|nr:hypothetical protein EDB81DRAFT_773793 [Dactylonectria macrodidyma]